MSAFVIAVDDPRVADVYAMGFTACGPFDNYSLSPSSTFMTLTLASAELPR